MEPKQHSLKGLTLTFSSFENEIDTVAAAAIDTYLSVLNVQHWAENISNLFTPFTSHFSVTVRRLHSLTLSHTHTQKEREKERTKVNTHRASVRVWFGEKERDNELERVIVRAIRFSAKSVSNCSARIVAAICDSNIKFFHCMKHIGYLFKLSSKTYFMDTTKIHVIKGLGLSRLKLIW